MIDLLLSEIPPWESYSLQDAFLDLFTIPVDPILVRISDGSLVFDDFLWPDSGVFQSRRFGNGPGDLTTIDIIATGDTTFNEQFAATCDYDAGSLVLSTPSPAIRSSDSQSRDPVPCQKRLQGCLYEFEGGPNTAPSRRKRRKFSSEH